MKLVDAANSLYLTLGTPSNVSIPAICAYYRNNYGEINSLLGKDYSVDSTTLELNESDGTEIGADEISIFNLLYEIKYYTRESRNFMGVGGVDQVLSAKSDGGEISFVNRNTSSAQYIQLRRDTTEQLNKLLNYYRFSKTRSLDIQGDDIYVVNTAGEIGTNNPRIRDLTNV